MKIPDRRLENTMNGCADNVCKLKLVYTTFYSIGFNNVVPAYIIGKPVWQYPLSEYTGQQKLSKIFDQKINIVGDTNGLIHIPKYEEEKMQLITNIKRKQRIYENEITTTFSKFLEVYTGNTEKREIMGNAGHGMRL